MGKRKRDARAAYTAQPRIPAMRQTNTIARSAKYVDVPTVPLRDALRQAGAKRDPAALEAAGSSWLRTHREALVWCGAFGIAVLAPVILRWLGVFAPVDDGLAALNFDADRVVLIDYVFAALLAGGMGALIGRRRGAAWIGGIAYYVFAYLLPFIGAAQHPGLSPSGLPQVIDPPAFIGTLLTLIGLGVTFAAIGAALGGALGEMLVGPLVDISRRLLWAMRRRHLDRRALAQSAGMLLASVLLLGAFTVAVRGVGDVLNYGPLTNDYQSMNPAGSTGVQHGVVLQRTLISPVLGGIARTYYIYLPPSYANEPTRRYPTLYLLHGGPGTAHNWVGAAQAPLTVDALVARDQMRETILVSPDGNGPIYRYSKWANSFDGRQRMEDFVVKDLVPYIDAHYRTLADAADRGIVGLSDGGYGAVNIALHYPDVFSDAVSEGGYFYAEGALFGSGPGSTSYHLYNSPAAYISTPAGAAAAHRLLFVICVGTSDGSFYHDGLAFVHELQQIGAHVTLIKRAGGHSWTDWAQMFGQAAPLIEPATHPVTR